MNCSHCQDVLLTAAPSNARMVATIDAHCKHCVECAELADAVQWQSQSLATRMNEYSSSYSPYALAEYARTAGAPRERPWGSRVIVSLLAVLLLAVTVNVALDSVGSLGWLTTRLTRFGRLYRPIIHEDVAMLQCLGPGEAAEFLRARGERDLMITIGPRSTRTLSVRGPDGSRIGALARLRALDAACVNAPVRAAPVQR